MNATKSAMIPIRHISINQAEGMIGTLVKGVSTSWAMANATLGRIRDQAPKDGSYYKTDVIVTWADGLEVRIREDVTNDGKYNADLANSIRSTWQFYAGFHKPDHLTEEQYDKITSDIPRRDAAVEYLKKYDLSDRALPVGKPLETPPVSKNEINAVIDRVGRLLTCVESPEMRSIMTTVAIRAGSLELRKAMAALIRAKEAM